MNDVLKRLEKVYVCDSGCQGRCRVCPQDVVNEAIDELERNQRCITELLLLLKTLEKEEDIGPVNRFKILQEIVKYEII